MVDTSDAWITERTGIKERHIQKGEGLGTSHMAAEAVRGLLQKTGTKPEDVDLLICATTTPDMQFPSTANMICDMVGIPQYRQLRRAGGLLGLSLFAHHRLAIHRQRHRAQGGGGGRRQDVVDHRLHRPRHLRAVRRRRRRRAAGAERGRHRHHGHADPLRRRRHDPSASEGRRQPHAGERADGGQAPALRPPGRRRGSTNSPSPRWRKSPARSWRATICAPT